MAAPPELEATQRVRPAERGAAVRRGEAVGLCTRRAGSLLLAVALMACAAAVSRSAGARRAALSGAQMQGNDGMEVDLSTLPRTAQMQDLAHAEGTAMGKGRGQYDALLQNGPLDPPRSSTLQKIATQSLAVKGVRATPALLQPGAGGGAQQHGTGTGIGIGGSVHLLRSAREILAGRMAAQLEGRHPAPKAKRMRGQPPVSRTAAEEARAVWLPPKGGPSLKERAAALEATVKKLEHAAGAAEISELDGLSKRR